MMKKIILIIIFCSLCFFLCKSVFSRGNNIKITADGNDMVIESGDNKFIAEIVSGYKENLRIYAITDNNESGWSPFGYAKYIFAASPLTGNTKSCERNAALSSPLLNMIVEDEDIENKINKLKSMTDSRRSATVIGKKVYIKEFFYKNEDHTDALKKQGKLDPHNAIIINNIVILE